MTSLWWLYCYLEHISRYPDNSPRGKLPPTVRVGVWVKVSVSFRVGGQPENSTRGKLFQLSTLSMYLFNDALAE